MSKEAAMKIKAIAPWFGGKRTLAPKIVELLGDHRVYWEPFCGSMAVLMAKPACRMETVNDLHGHLINLARVIADPKAGPKLYRRLRRTLFHEDLLAEARESLRSGDSLFRKSLSSEDDAYWYFIDSWMGRNGVAGTQSTCPSFCIRYTATGGQPATRFNGAVSSIPQWRRRLRGVAISRRNGFELLEKIADAPKTAIYVDPPYVKKSARYIHDFNPEDHERLNRLLSRFTKTRVVVSYYADPLIDELYANWNRVEVDVAKSLAHQSRRGQNTTRATELLLWK